MYALMESLTESHYLTKSGFYLLPTRIKLHLYFQEIQVIPFVIFGYWVLHNFTIRLTFFFSTLNLLTTIRLQLFVETQFTDAELELALKTYQK